MNKIENIILDTDMDTDCDDAGALAVLHNLANRNIVSIKGIICNVPSLWSCSFVQAANNAVNACNIPIGGNYSVEFSRKYRKMRQACIDRNLLYCETISRQHGIIPNKNFFPEDGLVLYRKLLASAENHSITICAIGLLSMLAELLNSGPCHYSKLSGKVLVAQKVKKLVTMGNGTYPSGHDQFNWAMDKNAANLIFSHWPTPIVVSSLGGEIKTGNNFIHNDCNHNPIGQAYRIFSENKPGFKRPSWDQIALMIASEHFSDLFKEIPGNILKYDAVSGHHRWLDSPLHVEHFYIKQLVNNQNIEEIVENAMTSKPLSRKKDGLADLYHSYY
jgi:inosine-uridine nucleoside N-ribohydrolase